VQALEKQNEALKLKLRALETECDSLRKQLADEKADRALYAQARKGTTFEEMTRWEEELRNFKPEEGVSLEEVLAPLESESNAREA
jgi:hypothetical protein